MSNVNIYDEFMALVNNRYSCRDYDPEQPVSTKLIESIVDAARLAPSACNRQPWTFVVVTDSETRQRILAKSRPAFLQAPVVIVACGHHEDAWHRPADNKDHTDVDLSIAVEHICLAATARGLATCWVCSFDVDTTRATLGLPENVEPMALIPVGYPTDKQVPEKKRKNLSEILRWEKF